MSVRIEDSHHSTVAYFDGKTLEDSHHSTVGYADGAISIVLLAYLLNMLAFK